ncbi:MAG: asparagine synthase (glutamine-hydrolyzing) [Chloroflexales bacterium]|nr:asparagine synthase (glutamine-hydrolyzing) [Chloroflexales bacterium]
MCGIVAVIDCSGPVAPETIDAMRAAIAHRGPDSGDTLLRSRPSFAAGLGSQRLSILDLSPAGKMPMANEDGTVWVAYNGEIYNHCDLRGELERRGHCYRSRTDTETLLHAYEEYGTDCFARFNGMFACVIYDEQHDQIVIARDRTGIKPLYYVEREGVLLCASELKALTATGLVAPEIDPVALDVYLALGYIPAPYALVKGVKKLPAATYGVYRAGRLELSSYWQPARTDRSSTRSHHWPVLVDATRAAVSGAIERQMMSDVPVGVMLSGGLDSTIVTAVARQVTNKELHTFSIGFAMQHSALEAIYNYDRDYARHTAAALGATHHEIVAHDTAELADHLRWAVRQIDEPVWEPTFLSIYLISTLARQHGVKVLLSGDGSDELFGGYPWYPALVRLEQIERIPGLAGLLPLCERLPLSADLRAKVRDLRRKYRCTIVAKYHSQYGVFDVPTRARIFDRTPDCDPVDAIVGPLLAKTEDWPLSDRFAVAEFALWVGEHFNQRLDRMTMAASVEGRVPFQDNAVVDLALTLRASDKLYGGVGKALLRTAFADRVPDFVLQRPKRPFAAPATAWMHGVLKPLIGELLSAESLQRLPLADISGLSGLSTSIGGSQPARQEQIWSLLHLMLWYEELTGAIPRSPLVNGTTAQPASANVFHSLATAIRPS